MAGDKGTARAPRSRSAPQVISPRNKVNVALPFAKITAEDAMRMRAGDWVNLAGLVVLVIGFSVAVRQLIRIADASEAARASHRANGEEAESLAGRSSPDVGTPIS
jgi:hypothetical protein